MEKDKYGLHNGVGADMSTETGNTAGSNESAASHHLVCNEQLFYADLRAIAEDGARDE
ncbi:hypothetical protein [Bacillus sp. T33-2]|uniref:hypothetical protein n=1 Tax=Bacillus sp. T33-2 TaxID=2054168 RepID=UPI0015E0CF38|nr:hypothetical protein [Bacillus sp. T33-2]